MWEDPIVKEIHEHRKAQLERFNGDINAYITYIRQKEKASNRNVYKTPVIGKVERVP